ncbi:MAG: hypothetical protein ACREPI_12415 [Candidatus Dormibacterales bacterium]
MAAVSRRRDRALVGWVSSRPEALLALALGCLPLGSALFSPARGILWEFPAVLLVPLGARALASTAPGGLLGSGP